MSELELEALLLWQPVASGDQFLNQFLRLRVAGAKLRGEEPPAPEWGEVSV